MLKILPYIDKLRANLVFWKRLVFGSIAVALMYYWYSGMMLHQVWDSPFNYKGADFTYWLYYFTGLPSLILHSETSALVFSIVIISVFVLNVIWVNQRFLSIVAGVLLLIYQVQFNMKIGYHAHHLFGFQFALLPFYFSGKNFYPSLVLARILACLAYFFAGFFKLYHGAWWYVDSYSNVLKNQHAAYDYFNQGDLRWMLSQYIQAHPGIGLGLFVSAMLLQLSFILGLFTRRLDVLLALSILLFHVMDWLLMNLGIFMSMTVLMWLLLYREFKTVEVQ